MAPLFTRNNYFVRAMVSAFSLSYRQLEEMMKVQGLELDHTTILRWIIRYVPELEKELNISK